MANKLDKFSAKDVEAGVDLFGSDFSSEYALDIGTKNIATGINAGAGPRQGMSPIPNHSNINVIGDVSVPSGVANVTWGLRASEQAGDEEDLFVNRTKFLGIQPLVNSEYEDATITSNDLQANQFIWLLGDNEDPDITTLSAVSNCYFWTSASTKEFFPYTFNIADGFTNNLWAQMLDPGFGDAMVGWQSPLISKVAAPSNAASLQTNPSEWVREFLSIGANTNYCSSAVLAVSGNKFPQPWLCMEVIDPPTSTTTATGNATRMLFVGATNMPLGINPSWNNRDYKRNNRTLTFWNYKRYTTGLVGIRLMHKYVYSSYPVDNGTYIPCYNQDTTLSNFLVSGNASEVIANDNGDPFSNADIEQLLLNDPELFCDSSYRMVLVAAEKPMAFFIQNFQRDAQGRNVQIAPLTDRLQKPFTQTTRAGINSPSVNYYTEEGIQVSTCFQEWPPYTVGTPLKKYVELAISGSPTQQVTLGAANSGILRANTTYEITFSIFDKQTGYETNVGIPAKIRTATDDNVALTLYVDSREAGGGDWYQIMPNTQNHVPIYNYNWDVASGGGNAANVGWVNFLEIRFYYRALGTYEWLPALFIDAAKYWFYPDHQALWACQGNVAGLPGGQPGGYNDYSFLPEDTYDCVVNFRSRAFWFSKNNCVFSLRNNPFAYPLRNSAPAPTGGFKGAISHTYRGQSEQNGRLVIFGEKETYIGKFSGLPYEVPVTVSPTVTDVFPLDGSDFTIESWTSITSFSHRSAVVADGDLYWWGPQGIYKDNGVGNPVHISDGLEPQLFELYDQSLTREIHCFFDEKTKLIWWFYPPVDDPTISHAIAFNIETNAYFFQEFDCKVDWAQRIQTNNPNVSQATNGLRTVMAVREDSSTEVQRGVFFDQVNRSGDYQPTKELLISEVSTGTSSTQKILKLDPGFDVSNFNSIVTGDYLALQQFERYTGQTADDLIAKVVSTNAVDGEITINIPTNAVYPDFAATDSRNFWPMWHKTKLTKGLNGIPWNFVTKYWCPLGPNYQGIWQWMYFMMKYIEWKKVDPEFFSVAYRTPAGGDFISDRIEFVNNSHNNMQVFHAFRQHGNVMTTGMNNNGQAVKLDFGSIHIGDEWQLQYFELQASLEDGNTLKQFQG